MASPRKARPQAIVRTLKLAVDYSRFSTEMQGSIPEQQAINDEIAGVEDVTIVARFVDEGVSRSLRDRPGLNALVTFLEAHPEIGFIVINELERLTAGVSQRDEMVRLCQRLRITVLTEDMGMIAPNDVDKMQQADERAVRAKGEVLKIQRRVRRNLRQKVIAGTVAMRPAYGTRMKRPVAPDGTELPAGVNMVDAHGKKITSGVLEIHPDEIEWLKQIFDWADEGASNDEIARRLNGLEIPTKTGRNPWRGNTVAGILRNPLYKGEMTWGHQETLRDPDGKTYLEVRAEGDPGRVIKLSPLGPLVPTAQWDRIETARAARSPRERRTARRKYNEQVFDNYIYCGRCGHKMYGRNDAAGRRDEGKPVSWRYYCYSSRPGYVQLDGFAPPCEGPMHSLLAKKIVEQIRLKVGTPGVAMAVHQKPRPLADIQRTTLEDRIVLLEAEHRRAVDLLMRALISEADYVETKLVRDAALIAAREQLESVPTSNLQVTHQIPATMDKFKDLADELASTALDVTAKRALLADAGLTRIYIDNPVVRLQFGEGAPLI